MLAGVIVTVAYLTSTQACLKSVFYHPLTAYTLLYLQYRPHFQEAPAPFQEETTHSLHQLPKSEVQESRVLEYA